MAAYEDDYIKKLIAAMGDTLAGALIGKNGDMDSENKEIDIVLSEEDLVHFRIQKFLRDREVNMAENILLEAIEKKQSPKYLQIAKEFYDQINKYTEKQLEECNFSRQEIIEDLEHIQKLYNCNA
ncbi:DUF6483 family protein [Anaerosacchariphilus polymeriproducens]|uniref:Uncharacterized protein n=1 Tax=Anaerosacchariphilus polymeriproducens TaxID=1812858 RepID=A0A371AV01_9FIRM|nr:DUF6483 family protein [Anaerosacchariphilus polymeriproducens]RDU23362.1 hypothetical protein DWV06_09920 [Anaerosacchariphilus polymeriproducens]